jgi:hypothetical protein
MKMKYTLAMLGVALLSAPQAFSQCAVDPLHLTRWTFNAQATAHQPEGGRFDHDFAIAGQVAAANGRLEILATSIIRRTPTRLERDAGSYTLNANCTGGTITMNLSSYPMQYDFWFYNNNRSLYMVSIIGGKQAVGSATRAPLGCPVGVTDPLGALVSSYTLKLQGLIEDPYAFAFAGVMTASGAIQTHLPAWLRVGGLDIVATSNLTRGGSVVRYERDRGSYAVADSCTYGSLTFNLSSFPVQYDFFFHEGHNNADVISTTPGRRIYGVFNR